MKLAKCDFCGTGPVEHKTNMAGPEGWRTLTVAATGSPYGSVRFDACEKCCERLGFEKVADRTTPQEDIYTILFEMVQEAMENQ
jgi:hypothetical protein